MKEKKRFICEKCHTEYDEKLACKKCEDNHKKPEDIVRSRYLSLKQDAKGYPITIEVVMSDGETVRYKRT